MMKRLMIVLLLLFACTPAPAAAEESTVPLERLILQQHFTQVELERNLDLTRAEEKKLLTDLARLDVELSRQALVIRAMRQRAGEVVRAYYTGERATLLTLVFNADNFADLLQIVDFLELLYERDLGKLERFQAEQAKRQALEAEKEQRLDQVRHLRAYLEQQLARILAIQEEKQKNLAKLKDPTSVETLMDHLVADWQKRGLPAFRRIFGLLANVMPDLPELATPDRITSDGLLDHTLTIREDEFNQFLAAKNDAFKQLAFRFADDSLIVDGSYDQVNVRLVGQYQLVSPTELKFHITQLLFDGFALPDTTVKEMENTYDLGFYPGLISPHMQVEQISLQHGELKLKIKLDLPLLFGSG